ncbi:MAG TPA: aldo/keto reductase [Chloroflexota bacterium]|nr:aldo/keto reductase [Chloroflexota bacterium]
MEPATENATQRITIGGDLTVNRVGLGTNRIRDDAASRAVLRRAVELGVNFIDTADSYTGEASERTIGEVLASYRGQVVIATKGGIVVNPSGERSLNASPEYLPRAVEGSLARLQVPQIDLYFLHKVDPKVPIGESVAALRELQAAGKIKQLGVSTVTLPQLEEARKHATIVAVENQYNISDRESDDVLDYCAREGIVFVPYYPVRTSRLAQHERELAPLLAKYDATPTQLALAWLLWRSPVMLPIPGTLSVEHLAQNVAAANIALAPDDAATLARLAG